MKESISIKSKLRKLKRDLIALDTSKLQDIHRGEYYCLKDLVCDISDCDEYIYNVLWAKYDSIKLLIEYIESKAEVNDN